MLFSYLKKYPIIENHTHILLQKIQDSVLTEAVKQDFINELRKIDKQCQRADFKAQKAVVDKGVITNILRNNLKELEAKNKIIAEQIAFKEQMLANVNHELRTPLNAIIGMCSLLQQTVLDNRQQEYTDIIKRSSESLLIIINDFLTLSSIKADKIDLQIRPFSIKEIFNDLHNIFAAKTQQKGIELRLTTAFNLPDYFMGDATRIYQILQNLLTNAIKFTQKGFVLMNVTIKKDLGNLKLVEFIIEDTGIGIPKAKQETIFESFTQAHRAGNKDYMGTGLGLNIVKNLVELMDGEIFLESEENKGTKFTFTLPLRPTHSLEVSNDIKEAQIKIPIHWQQKKFLMIEDNLANIIYAREVFEKWELDITFCKTYAEGLQTANDRFFDLILSDLKLPDGNGIDLLTEIRHNPESACFTTQIAIITASILASDREKAQALKVAGYIEKPFVPKKLLSELYLMLEGQLPSQEHIIMDTSSTIEQSHKIMDVLNKLTQKTHTQIEFIEILMTQIEECFMIMDQAILQTDYDQIYYITHKIKSTLKIFDLKELYNQVMSMEEYSYAKEHIFHIKNIYTTFRQKLYEHIAVLKDLKEQLEAKEVYQ